MLVACQIILIICNVGLPMEVAIFGQFAGVVSTRHKGRHERGKTPNSCSFKSPMTNILFLVRRSQLKFERICNLLFFLVLY